MSIAITVQGSARSLGLGQRELECSGIFDLSLELLGKVATQARALHRFHRTESNHVETM